MSRQAIGQATGGTLRGTVKDSTGAVVPDAVVTAANEATGAKFDTVTSSAGLYSFPNLLVGSYSVSAEHIDLKNQSGRMSQYPQIRSRMPMPFSKWER